MEVQKVDAVLIDDDVLVRMTWEISARKNGKTICVFSGFREFLALAHQFDLACPIYIDSNLGVDQKGEDISQELFLLGFKEIYLSTGFPADKFKKLPWIAGILGKYPPWEKH